MKAVSLAVSAIIAFGSGFAYAGTCAGHAIVGQSSSSSANAISALLTQMNTKLVCNPSSGAPWTNQEWHSTTTSPNGTVTEYKLGTPADPTKTNYASYAIGAVGIGGGNYIPTISYTYASGYSDGPYIVAVSASSSGTMYFCISPGNNNNVTTAAVTASFRTVAAAAGCP